MRVIDLALKDLVQVTRDWKSALFLVIMPLVFTGFLGFMLSGTEQAKDPRWPVGIIDQDEGGALSSALTELIASSDALRPVALTGSRAQRADELVSKGELVAAVVVPVDYSQQLLGGGDARLTLIVDDSTQAGHSASTALQGLVDRLLGMLEAAQLSTKALAAREGAMNEAARQAYLEEGLRLAQAKWAHPPLAVAVEVGGGTRGSEARSAAPSNPFTQSSPGMIVQFVVSGLMGSASVLVLERKSRALQRLLTTPISRAEVIGGHVLAMFGVVCAQEVLLVSAGQLLFGVNYMREPVATLLLIVAFALFAASLGLLIGAVSKREEQVIMWCLIAMFVLTALGGAWFPLDVTGKAFSTIGHLTPTAWAMDGFQNIVLRNLGLNSIWLPVGVLVGYAMVLFALAVWRFRFE